MSRSDREMLELAAKAAGRHVIGWNDQGGVEVAVLDDGTHFQPLHENGITDCMGDALRLAVKRHMTVRCYMGHTCVQISIPGQLYVEADETDHANPAAATRRAIVRAAAEIGASK